MSRNWSDEQIPIFQWFKDPLRKNLVVQARAGTGKTTTILEGIMQAPERKKLICAFSKIIKDEIQAKVGKSSGVTVQTLHSIGFQAIRGIVPGVKVDFTSFRADSLTNGVVPLGTPEEVKKLISKLHTKGREIKPHATQVGDLTDLAYAFDCDPPAEIELRGYDLDWIELNALRAMELASRDLNNGTIIDGSDMIFLPVRNKWLRGQYDLVVVDEAQDMTVAQLEIAQGVLRRGGRMAIVGDDRQAIFGFRGADSESLFRLKEELRAEELKLTRTYRCGKIIVDYAKLIVEDYRAADQNCEGVINNSHRNKMLDEASAGDFILSRSNAPLVPIALRLLTRGKRTRIAGKEIGKGLITLVHKFKARTVPDFVQRVEVWLNKETARIDNRISVAPPNKIDALVAKREELQEKAEMLLAFADSAKGVSEITSRIEALFSDDKMGAANTITCSTVHKAKGLEANRVFVLMDTLRWNFKEELNINYVAFTRAKEVLFKVSEKFAEESV